MFVFKVVKGCPDTDDPVMGLGDDLYLTFQVQKDCKPVPLIKGFKILRNKSRFRGETQSYNIAMFLGENLVVLTPTNRLKAKPPSPSDDNYAVSILRTDGAQVVYKQVTIDVIKDGNSGHYRRESLRTGKIELASPIGTHFVEQFVHVFPRLINDLTVEMIHET